MYSFLSSIHTESNITGSLLLDCYIRTPSTVMVRSSILEKAGLFEVGIIPDHDMWIRIKELSEFYYIEDKLFSYRCHNEQLSQISSEKMWRQGFGTLQRALDRYPYPSDIRRRRLAILHYRLGEAGVKTNRPSLLIHFLIAFFYDPQRAIKTLLKIK